MLRSILPAPRSLLGFIPLETGALVVAGCVLSWNLVGVVTGYVSAWVLYNVWMVVSSAALFYGYYKRDHSHVRWFALALFLDLLVYIAYIPYDPELTMTDTESCKIAMVTNRDLTMEYCLEHVHEIKNIAYMIRVTTVLIKSHFAGLAKSYEDAFSAATATQEPQGPRTRRR